MTNETLIKLSEVFENLNSPLFLRGKLMNPKKRVTQDTGEVYYEFDVKVLKNTGSDLYNQGWSKFHCLISTERAKSFSDEQLTELKGNEVIILADLTGQVESKPTVTYNKYNTIWVNQITLSRKIEKVQGNNAVVNL